MFEPNVDEVLRRIRPNDKVLDIGGWARPFNRANVVLDAEPYETRGYYGKLRSAQGGDPECFTKDTWIVRDICEKSPFPFADKYFDYCICSHTLEDIRDPLFVCSEVIRVSKAGYIEVPSRLAESSRGVEPGIVGWSHHRWLINFDATKMHASFLQKFHKIHSNFRYSLPTAFARRQPPEAHVQWLFWADKFTFEERTIHGVDNIGRELEEFVEQHYQYSAARLGLDSAIYALRDVIRRVGNRARRLVGL